MSSGSAIDGNHWVELGWSGHGRLRLLEAANAAGSHCMQQALQATRAGMTDHEVVGVAVGEGYRLGAEFVTHQVLVAEGDVVAQGAALLRLDTRQLAAEVGIQAGSLYNHISTKQDLLFDLVQDHINDLLRELDLALEGKPHGGPLPAEQVGWAIPQLYKAWARNLGACVVPETYLSPDFSIALFERGFIYYSKSKRML